VNKAGDAVCSRLVEGALEQSPDFIDKKIPAKPKLAGKSFLKREEETPDRFPCRAIAAGLFACIRARTRA